MGKAKQNHVGIHGKDIACFHCGKRETVIHGGGLPIGGPAWAGFMSHCAAFEKIHLKCKETPESPTLKLERDEHEWERGLFVGTSSATIFHAMLGRWPMGMSPGAYTPSDPSDFGRCHRLLKIKPEWRARLVEVSAKHPKWKPLVEHWDELEGMFERAESGMYDRMKLLMGER